MPIRSSEVGAWFGVQRTKAFLTAATTALRRCRRKSPARSVRHSEFLMKGFEVGGLKFGHALFGTEGIEAVTCVANIAGASRESSSAAIDPSAP